MVKGPTGMGARRIPFGPGSPLSTKAAIGPHRKQANRPRMPRKAKTVMHAQIERKRN